VTYTITILRRAQKELSDLPQDSYVRVRDAIRNLSEQPRPTDSKKLVGRPGWRMRVGSYRVVHEIDDTARLITIVHIGHLRDVHR
jgi:mRNA interferase RelE/StbE